MSECKELNPLSDPEFKEYVANEEALAHDSGYAEGYNRGFEDGKRSSTWQPIETAPDNRKIMIFSDTYGWEFCWYDEESYRWSCYPHKPKAWMEIPEPPK